MRILSKFQIIILLILLSTNLVHAKTIYSNIPFLQGADLCNFEDTFSQSRREFIKEKVYLASDFFSQGATGDEISNLFAQFDSMYDQHRQDALINLNISIENLLKSNLQKLFSYYLPKNKNIEFNHLSKNSDFIAIGSFTVSSFCNGNVILTLDLINTRNGKIISFDSEADVITATTSISNQLFDYFQKTKFPSIITRDDGSKLTILGTPMGRINKRVDWTTGYNACKAMSARLPNESEVREIDMYGDYSGGITLTNVDEDQSTLMFLLNTPNTVYYNLFGDQAVQNFNMLNSKTAFFFCVK